MNFYVPTQVLWVLLGIFIGLLIGFLVTASLLGDDELPEAFDGPEFWTTPPAKVRKYGQVYELKDFPENGKEEAK